MTLNNFYVYVHKRADNNVPFYVGKGSKQRAWTKRTRNQRWCSIVQAHGLTIEIVKNELTEKQAFDFEIQLIVKLKTRNTFGGANFTNGGGGISGCKRTQTQQTRDKIHAKLIGIKHSIERCANISKGRKGKGKWSKELTNDYDLRVAKMAVSQIGRVQSEKTRKKISKSLLSRQQCLNVVKQRAIKNQKPVEQIDQQTLLVIKKFFSVNEASLITKTNKSKIGACANGFRKTAGGFIWRRVDEKKQ